MLTKTLDRIWHRAAREYLGLRFAAERQCELHLRKPRVQFLVFHRLLKCEESWFEGLIHALASFHTFTTYSDAVDRILQNRIDGPYLVVSFDDGLKNHYRAAEILAACGVSACFFVCPSIVGETRAEAIAEFCRTQLRTAPTEFLDWDELAHLKKLGHEIGGHTMNHENLAALSLPELNDTIARSREVLSGRLGETRHFAWPYGRFWHFTPEGAAAVFASGYDSCASAEHGCHMGGTAMAPSEICIRRYTVPANCSPGGLLYPLALSAMVSTVEGGCWPANWYGIRNRPCLHCELFVDDEHVRHSWICKSCRLVRPSVRHAC